MIDYKLEPAYSFIQKEIESVLNSEVEMSGMSDAYVKGLLHILKEVECLDGGLSESYLEGLQKGLEIYQKSVKND